MGIQRRLPAPKGSWLFFLAVFAAFACSADGDRAAGPSNDSGGGSTGSPADEGGLPIGVPADGATSPEGGNPDAANVPDGPPPPDPVITVPNGTLKLEVWGDRIIRVLYGNTAPTPAPSLAVVEPRPSTPFTVSETDTELTVATSKLKAHVDKMTGQVSFLDAAGTPLLAEPGTDARSLTAGMAGGVPTLVARQTLAPAGSDSFYGLGQHQQGHMTYNGLSTTLAQKNTDIAVPMLVSSGGYGVLWDNPSVTTVDLGGDSPIPAANLFSPAGVSGGLEGEYFDGVAFDTSRGKRIDPAIDFTWPDSPLAGVGADHFSVRWSGQILSSTAGEYTFTTTEDDGARLWVNGQLLVDDWLVHAAESHSGKITLLANTKYDIKLEFYENTFGAQIKLGWSPPGGAVKVAWQSEAANLIDYYFMYGPEIDDVIASYRALTGAAPMLGRWAWGYWQSKEHYNSQTELLAVVQGYRDRMLPLDGIVQDWFYWDPDPWGSHHFDPKRYPDPAAMFAGVHQNHAHALLSVWAKFDKGSDNYNALQAAGALFTPAFNGGNTTYYDPFKPEGRTLYWQQMRDELFAKGVDAWWLDATEPELGVNWGEFRTTQTAMGPGALVYNAFPLMTTTAVYQGQRAASKDKRVFILTRSAYSGQQRNSAVSWSGDINGDWPTFKKQIPAGLNFSLSGIPYWNTDIGGFFPQTAITSPEYRELYLRWFEFGAFCPMFRSHGTGGDKEMWRFGTDAQAILLGVDELRYRLLPYIYSLSWKVTHEGYSMMRGLVFDFRSDAKALDVGDQFMFGPALMVNPVTDPGATSRPVYLPAKTTWYDFWTGATLQGGASTTASAPLDHIPVYVRAGAIVPMGPVMQFSTEKPCDPIEVRVYAGADGAFTLYEDENDNYDYETGMYATIPLTWSESKKTLSIGARQGSFPGMLQSRTFRVVFVGPGHGTGVPESATADKTVTYTGAAIDVTKP